MVSPELQRAAIEQAAPGYGVEIVEWMEGLDESGSKRRSPWWATLDRAVSRVESGELHAILVWKFSRVARNRLKWAVALDRVEQAGGLILSASEKVDAATAVGRFTRGMLKEIDALTAETIGEQWKEAQARRVRLGLPATGRGRFGYEHDRDGYTPDPATGPLLVDVYRRYVGGESLRSLARMLNDAGALTVRGNRWSAPTLGACLDAGFAAGLLRTGTVPRRSDGTFLPGAHVALIDRRLWEAFRRRRREVAATAPRLRAPTRMLSGLVRCGLCGGAMSAHTPSRTRPTRYLCRLHSIDAARCPGQPPILAATVEAVVVGWLRGLITDRERRDATRIAVKAARSGARADLAVLTRQLLDLERQREKLASEWSAAGIPLVTMRKLMADLAEREAELQRAVDRAGDVVAVDPARWPGHVVALDDETDPAVLHGHVRAALMGGKVAVYPDEPRVRPEPAW